MKTALYGGSFDPIHAGHIQPVLEACEQLGLDRVIYLPTARPPHKPGRQFASSYTRFAMVELALLDHPQLVVSPLELTPGRVAYTVDSVRHFRELYRQDELVLLIGADSFVRFGSWRDWEEILKQVRLAVLTRPGWDVESAKEGMPEPLRVLVDQGQVDFIENEPVEASSTKLRQLFAAAERPPEGWMPERVVQYVLKYSHYQ